MMMMIGVRMDHCERIYKDDRCLTINQSRQSRLHQLIKIIKCFCWCINRTIIPFILLICSRNRVPGPGSKIPYPVPNLGNYHPVFHHGCTKYHQFWPAFASIHNIVALMYFQLHLHKLHRSITRRVLKLWRPDPSRCGFRYLLRSDGIWNQTQVPG